MYNLYLFPNEKILLEEIVYYDKCSYYCDNYKTNPYFDSEESTMTITNQRVFFNGNPYFFINQVNEISISDWTRKKSNIFTKNVMKIGKILEIREYVYLWRFHFAVYDYDKLNRIEQTVRLVCSL